MGLAITLVRFVLDRSSFELSRELILEIPLLVVREHELVLGQTLKRQASAPSFVVLPRLDWWGQVRRVEEVARVRVGIEVRHVRLVAPETSGCEEPQPIRHEG